MPTNQDEVSVAYPAERHLSPRLAGRLGLRAEYRGQLFFFHDYRDEAARQPTVSSQPTVSRLYRFGARH